LSAGDGKPTRGRPSKNDLVAGTKLGDLTIIQKVRTPPGAPGGQRYRLECVCGKRITKPRFYIVGRAQPLRHCGCKTPKADDPYTKRSWYAMHSRCYYKKHRHYSNYGGRGITVCWRWHKDNPEGWENFKADMGTRPFGLSIERKDNNGSYTPDNCCWATAKEQRANQRPSNSKLPTRKASEILPDKPSYTQKQLNPELYGDPTAQEVDE